MLHSLFLYFNHVWAKTQDDTCRFRAQASTIYAALALVPTFNWKYAYSTWLTSNNHLPTWNGGHPKKLAQTIELANTAGGTISDNFTVQDCWDPTTHRTVFYIWMGAHHLFKWSWVYHISPNFISDSISYPTFQLEWPVCSHYTDISLNNTYTQHCRAEFGVCVADIQNSVCDNAMSYAVCPGSLIQCRIDFFEYNCWLWYAL